MIDREVFHDAGVYAQVDGAGRVAGSGCRTRCFMGFSEHQLVIFAARSGNVAKLRERLRAGGDINHFHPKDGSPLIAAIRSHRVAAVEWLLANGADANANYGDDTGPLEIALRRPNLEIVGLLLAAGARLRRKSRPYYAVRLKNCLKALGRRR
jgi:ankyrin repeat protein